MREWIRRLGIHWQVGTEVRTRDLRDSDCSYRLSREKFLRSRISRIEIGSQAQDPSNEIELCNPAKVTTV